MEGEAEGYDITQKQHKNQTGSIIYHLWHYPNSYPRKEDKKLLAIAIETGYPDFSSFCRSFKKETGMSPSQYRDCFLAPKPNLSKKA